LFVVICIIHFHRNISLSDVLYRALSLAFMLFVGIHNPLHQNMPLGIEHINRRFKIFKILAERYCNRRRRYG
jgi:hypothetical protein